MMNHNDIQEYVKCREDILYFVEKYLSIKLYDWQKDFINNQVNYSKTARQVGYSIMSIISIIHGIIFNDSQTYVYITQNRHMSDFVKRHLLDILYMCSYEFKPSIRTNTAENLVFDNNIRIKFVTLNQNIETSLRGYAITRLYMSECAPSQEYSENLEYSLNMIYSINMSTTTQSNKKFWVWGNHLPHLPFLSEHKTHIPFWITSNEMYTKYKTMAETLPPHALENEYSGKILLR